MMSAGSVGTCCCKITLPASSTTARARTDLDPFIITEGDARSASKAEPQPPPYTIFGQGRMFGADELVRHGMADRVGTLSQVLERYGAVIHPVASSASARRHMAEIRQAMDALSQISNLLKVK